MPQTTTELCRFWSLLFLMPTPLTTTIHLCLVNTTALPHNYLCLQKRRYTNDSSRFAHVSRTNACTPVKHTYCSQFASTRSQPCLCLLHFEHTQHSLYRLTSRLISKLPYTFPAGVKLSTFSTGIPASVLMFNPYCGCFVSQIIQYKNVPDYNRALQILVSPAH